MLGSFFFYFTELGVPDLHCMKKRLPGFAFFFRVSVSDFLMEGDQLIQLWHSELNRQTSKRGEAGNKLRTYRLFKSRFQLEGYLSQVKVAKNCIALTKLKVSCHRLQIELWRYHKPHSLPQTKGLANCATVLRI